MLAISQKGENPRLVIFRLTAHFLDLLLWLCSLLSLFYRFYWKVVFTTDYCTAYIISHIIHYTNSDWQTLPLYTHSFKYRFLLVRTDDRRQRSPIFFSRSSRIRFVRSDAIAFSFDVHVRDVRRLIFPANSLSARAFFDSEAYVSIRVSWKT